MWSEMPNLMTRTGSIVLVMFALVAGCGTGDTKQAAPVVRDSTSQRADSGLGPAVASLHEPPAVTPQPAARVDTPRSSTPPVKVVRAKQGPRRVVIAGVDLTGLGYDQGNPAAPVVIVDFSDFACPYCAEFSRETYAEIAREFVSTGKVLFKYVPFVAGSFRHSREATRAAECAAEQGRFWEMLDRVYAVQQEWKTASDAVPVLAREAAAAGLDTARAAACYASGRTDARTARLTSVANDIGVRVTPSFVVNGRPIQGALPLADFRNVIQAALLVTKSKDE